MTQITALTTDERIPAVPMIEPTRLWFSEADGEVEHSPAEVDGTLPAWLTGTLVRNGAAAFGNGAAKHQLDGSALLHRFAFPGDGTATYGSKFLRTKARAAMEEGRIGYNEFASDPCRRFAEPIATLFSPRYTDNTSVNVAKLGEQFLALTETPIPVAFDPETLETLGVGAPPPGRGGRTPTAHPHMDPRTGGWITTQIQFGARSSYRIYEQHPDGSSKQLVNLPSREPAYLHSFAVTERSIVLVEQPFRVRPLDLISGTKPFIQQYRWKPELGTIFHVFDRSTGVLRSRHQGPAFFAFHHVNAFDDGADVVVDISTYDDPTLIDQLYLDDQGLVKGDEIATGSFKRFRLPPGGDAIEQRLCESPFEWPRVHPDFNGKPYTAAYGASAMRDFGGHLEGAAEGSVGFRATIAKVDVAEGGVLHWAPQFCMPGEPVMIPRPGATAEDDGVLLTVVFDALAGRSFAAVLDAATLDEIARVNAPARIPFGFHGDYFPDSPSGAAA